MEITTKLVEHLADLSRLEFNDEEKENFKAEFSKILDEIKKMESVDVSNVVLKSNLLDAKKDLKEDCPSKSLSKDEAIKDAPDTMGSSIAVPMMVD